MIATPAHSLRGAMLFLVAALLASCAGKRATESRVGAPDLKTSKIEPEARTLFFQGERYFQQKNFDQARLIYQQVKTKYPRGRAAMLSSYRLGTINYYLENYPTAAREFEYFLARWPTSELAFDVNYNLAASEYQQGNYERAYQMLARFRVADIQAQGPRRAEVIYALTAQTASALGNHAGAVVALAAQAQLPIDEGTRSTVNESIDGHLSKVTSRAELDRLLAEVTETATRGKITARLASLANAETVAAVESPVGRSQLEDGEGKGLPLTSGTSAEKWNIGVILPLTGKGAPYGKKALEGILLAAGVFRSSRDYDFRIFVEDSGNSPAQAQQAVDILFSQHKVSAIIGPLNFKESLAVADRAQQLGVLNLSLSGKEGLADRGAYLFQNALTPRVQMESLLGHCIQEKGMRRFAILAPNDNFGRDMANQFWDMTEKYGGKIVAYHTYPPEEKDFQSYIRDLVGVANAKFRRLETAKLAEYIQEVKAKTGREPKTARLPPIIDFDAIFIPDSPKNIGSIAASLAYFDVNHVPLLGTTEWNSDQLYKRGGKYVEGAIFPGGISNATRNTRQRDFIRAYADAYAVSPDLLAGQAYEAMELLGAAVNRSSSDRNDLVQELTKLRDFESPLGSVSFDSTRIARRKLPVYSLGYNGAIVEQ